MYISFSVVFVIIGVKETIAQLGWGEKFIQIHELNNSDWVIIFKDADQKSDAGEAAEKKAEDVDGGAGAEEAKGEEKPVEAEAATPADGEGGKSPEVKDDTGSEKGGDGETKSEGGTDKVEGDGVGDKPEEEIKKPEEGDNEEQGDTKEGEPEVPGGVTIEVTDETGEKVAGEEGEDKAPVEALEGEEKPPGEGTVYEWSVLLWLYKCV